MAQHKFVLIFPELIDALVNQASSKILGQSRFNFFFLFNLFIFLLFSLQFDANSSNYKYIMRLYSLIIGMRESVEI